MANTDRRNKATSKTKTMKSALHLSRNFHGTDDQVVKLDKREQKPLEDYGVVLGEVVAIEYRPLKGSRAPHVWRHESGDKGNEQSSRKPLLVVNPKTKRPAIVMHRSGMKFSSKRGLVG